MKILNDKYSRKLKCYRNVITPNGSIIKNSLKAYPIHKNGLIGIKPYVYIK